MQIQCVCFAVLIKIFTTSTLIWTRVVTEQHLLRRQGHNLFWRPGAAAGGMGIEINTGNSCYLSAARRRRGRFFSPIGSGPRGSGLWNGDRDKHWEQLLFISGPSSPGAVFFSY